MGAHFSPLLSATTPNPHSQMHMSGVAPVNETLSREMSGVCKACFSGGDAGGRARGVLIEVRGVWSAGGRLACAQARPPSQGTHSGVWMRMLATCTRTGIHARTCRPSRSHLFLTNSLQPAVREAFMRDLSPDAPTFPTNLGELTKRLKAWRSKLQARTRPGIGPLCQCVDICVRACASAHVCVHVCGVGCSH